MTDLPRPTDIDQTVALEWLRFSLGQGKVIAPEVLKVVEERHGHTYALVPGMVETTRLANPHTGGVTGTRAALDALVILLNTFNEHGDACVVLEDELSLRRDPHPDMDGLPTAFVGERVIHWADLTGGTEAAIHLFERGSHGYPLNAFVTSAPHGELGLVNDAEVGVHIADAVVKSLVAVIVAAYDAETYMIWEPS